MTDTSDNLRIGDMARLVGTTPRTIRYYEEIGLLPEEHARPAGSHRLYSSSDVDRLREVVRLRDLLGVSLDELKTLLAAEQARAQLRSEWHRDDVPPARRGELLTEALGHIERQLELVRRRTGELAKLEHDLADKRTRVRRLLRELDTRTATRPELSADAVVRSLIAPGAPAEPVRGTRT